jgi:2-oxoglutarate ferredoxin oxidoreductase subunit alpha
VVSVLGLSLETAQKIVAEAFGGKDADFNEALLEKGFSIAATGVHCATPVIPLPQKGKLLDASTTVSDGMVKAGLNFFVAYPMTPASPVLHYLAKKQKDYSIKVIHPENELSAINMSMGISYGGKRVATSTAGGGFALMQETFSFAGISELPVVVVLAQRPAPGTGVPTYTSQSDLFFSVFAGHGEFPRIVLAPGDAEEAYYIGGNAMNLAWKYQVPVIVLMDKQLAESGMSGNIDESRVTVETPKMAQNVDATYNRYALSEDGVSPIAFAGTKDAIVKMTSYEHDESGIVTEDAKDILAMNDKRFAKTKHILADVQARGAVKVYGDTASKTVLLTWGSTKGSVLEAMKYLSKPVKVVQVISLEPLDTETLAMELGNAEMIIDVELNHAGQLADLIRQKMGIEVTAKITRYDGRPFEPKELAKEIENKLQ